MHRPLVTPGLLGKGFNCYMTGDFLSLFSWIFQIYQLKTRLEYFYDNQNTVSLYELNIDYRVTTTYTPPVEPILSEFSKGCIQYL